MFFQICCLWSNDSGYRFNVLTRVVIVFLAYFIFQHRFFSFNINFSPILKHDGVTWKLFLCLIFFTRGEVQVT